MAEIFEELYKYVRGVFNKFTYFFVQAIRIVADS